MTTLSIHPIEYVREHVEFAHIIKKLLRLVMLIGLTLSLVGALCNTLASINSAARDGVVEPYMNAFPAAMPDMAIEPMNGFPVY